MSENIPVVAAGVVVGLAGALVLGRYLETVIRGGADRSAQCRARRQRRCRPRRVDVLHHRTKRCAAS